MRQEKTRSPQPPATDPENQPHTSQWLTCQKSGGRSRGPETYCHDGKRTVDRSERPGLVCEGSVNKQRLDMLRLRWKNSEITTKQQVHLEGGCYGESVVVLGALSGVRGQRSRSYVTVHNFTSFPKSLLLLSGLTGT